MSRSVSLKRYHRLSIIACVMAVMNTLAAAAAAQTAPAIIRFEPNGPGGTGLTGPDAHTTTRDGVITTTYTYYKSPLNPRLSTGIWETTGFHGALRKTRNTEFIHLLRGTITLADADGHEELFHAGDNLLIPKGAEVQWKKTENVKEYWAIFDADPPGQSGAAAPPAAVPPAPAATDAPAPKVIRLLPDGPPDKGLTAHGKTRSYKYFTAADKSFVGVWETDPTASPNFHKTKYTELMVFLSGTVTLSTPSGQSETFHGGDVALLPRGIEYKWTSDTARKFYAIFDFEPPATTAPAAGGQQ